MAKQSRTDMRAKRKVRSRKKINGDAERPRLSVFRSARHVYLQVIDDGAQKTLVSAHTFGKDQTRRANIEACKALGKVLAEKCLAKNIKKVVFDKNGYAYHGRVQAIADGAREGGLQF